MGGIDQTMIRDVANLKPIFRNYVTTRGNLSHYDSQCFDHLGLFFEIIRL